MILRHSWQLLMATVVVAGATFLGSCGGGGSDSGSATSQSSASETIKIGSLQSTTGGTSTFGQSTNKGIILAQEERNKAGGILGKQIEIIQADDQSQSAQVRQAVLKLIEQDKVCAILGEVASGRTAAAAPDCQSNHIPLVSTASTRNDVTAYGNYIFRTCFTDDLQGKWVTEFVSKNLHLTKAALLIDVQNPYSVGLGKVIAAEFPKLGGTIFATENYSTGQKDFRDQLTNLRASNPEIIFLPGYYTEVVNILPQARSLGMKMPFIGTDGWDADETIKIGKADVNGCYFSNHYAPDDPDPKVAGFVEKFKTRYNGEVPDAMAVLGYDAANLLFDAVQKAGAPDGEKIRDAIAATKDFPGVTGNITINKDRNAEKPGVILQIVDGHYKMVARVGESAGATSQPAK